GPGQSARAGEDLRLRACRSSRARRGRPRRRLRRGGGDRGALGHRQVDVAAPARRTRLGRRRHRRSRRSDGHRRQRASVERDAPARRRLRLPVLPPAARALRRGQRAAGRRRPRSREGSRRPRPCP
ncbi:MAG: Cell division transporter, ATP-binding protein FtsE, partial [uncultured Solirubrobacteraceae bacterium]